MSNKLNVVLYNPEIPQNTGNIIRTCYNHGVDLHIIKPMGFDITDPKMKRASVTYVDKINYFLYDSWEDFLESNPDADIFYTTKFARKNPSDIDFTSKEYKNLFLVFGAESTGVPKRILFDNYESCIRIPMSKDFRSFNLANTVSITLYEVARQNNFIGMEKYWDED